MEFTWDGAKNEENIHKHGISFEQAAEIFGDPFQVVIENYLYAEDGEQREMIIGMSYGLILIAAVFVDRQGNIHIINARRAEKYEEKIYRDNLPES